MLCNPYLDFFKSSPPSFRRDPAVPLDNRELYSPEWLMLKAAIAKHFAWAVPTEEAIDTVRKFTTKVIEIGAGSGYWAWMMEQKGISVRAFDVSPPTFAWHAIESGGESMVTAHPDRTLLLCWPPYGVPVAANALVLHNGEYMIFVGEWHGGCADPTFFSILKTNYREVAFVALPQWYMRDDSLRVFQRKHRLRSKRG